VCIYFTVFCACAVFVHQFAPLYAWRLIATPLRLALIDVTNVCPIYLPLPTATRSTSVSTDSMDYFGNLIDGADDYKKSGYSIALLVRVIPLWWMFACTYKHSHTIYG
jgi:hypothetical protein